MPWPRWHMKSIYIFIYIILLPQSWMGRLLPIISCCLPAFTLFFWTRTQDKPLLLKQQGMEGITSKLGQPSVFCICIMITWNSSICKKKGVSRRSAYLPETLGQQLNSLVTDSYVTMLWNEAKEEGENCPL